MGAPIIHIDLDAIDRRLKGGELWITDWGNWEAPDAPTCLHGAIRYCQPVPGDAYLIEQVGAKYGFGTSDNDHQGSWAEVRGLVPADITDDMLEATFGPQWEAIVALVRRAAVITPDEANRLHAAEDAAWDAARDAARAAARDAAWYAAGDAAWALVVRDLIGQHGFTQEHYDTLTRPWATVIGPVHPDDPPISQEEAG